MAHNIKMMPEFWSGCFSAPMPVRWDYELPRSGAGGHPADPWVSGWSASLCCPRHRDWVGWLFRLSGTQGCNGITGSKQPKEAHKRCARTAKGSHASCGRHGRRRDGLKGIPLIVSRSRSRIRIGWIACRIFTETITIRP
jgi:hypothetical protein